jgi:hypothetical protein
MAPLGAPPLARDQCRKGSHGKARARRRRGNELCCLHTSASRRKRWRWIEDEDESQKWV